tara:strand:- start:2520 stop:2843 length:324 start_codon:yes stop_codon:yes gene_type:complete
MKADIDFTDNALKYIDELRKPTPTIRIGLKPAGCTGFEYEIKWDNIITEDDYKEDFGTFKVAIDKLSYPKIKGSTVDVVEDGINRNVRIINPQEVASCGCGASVNFE